MLCRSWLLVAVILAPLAVADADEQAQQYSPYADLDHATDVFWGDTHVHSSWSPDAGAGGNLRLGPDEAYQFARGDTVTAHNGTRVALRRPLDFLLVSDHSEYMGIYPMLEEGLPELLATETGKRWAELVRQGKRAQVGQEFAAGLPAGEDMIESPGFQRSIWERVVANAERYDDPGRFTAFIGYEWTSMPGGANLHRIVLFADGAEQAAQVVPFRSIDSSDPEDLWAYLADYEQRTGGRAFAIPHNSNLSAGRMFELTTYDGKPLTKAYAQERTRWEPVVEATQIKGDSETAPYLSPDDEFADFGTWDANAGMGTGDHRDEMYAGEYVRSALGNGVVVAEQLGANPFEFGLIGSTDAHTGLATADDDDFWGKFSSNEPSADRLSRPWSEAFLPPEGSELRERLGTSGMGRTSDLVASGFAAVWARENTRAALFEAMKRRETYSTTGPRMVVRFFGGWDFAPDAAFAPDLAAVGYAGGTPMGGHLSARPGNATPSFLVSALRDPEGANLDRIQIVKQWMGEAGERRERIFDVAVSGGRTIGADGRCREPVGDTVDVKTATYRNTIGDSQLTAVWRDPDFDAKRKAVYYVRVLEIPTPRWTTYDAARFGFDPPDGVPATTQERAYTSPIWYGAE
jgi:hypothetical protein